MYKILYIILCCVSCFLFCILLIAEVLKLFCDASKLRPVMENDKILISDLREDIPDEVIELNVADLERFFSREAWLLISEKGISLLIFL